MENSLNQISQPNIPSNTKIILDANENTDVLIKSIEEYYQKRNP